MSRNHLHLHRKRWLTVRRKVFERDGHRCVLCGRAGRLECDHAVPLEVVPGQNPYDLGNLQALCRSCHIAKTAGENRRTLTPAEQAWRDFVGELAAR